MSPPLTEWTKPTRWKRSLLFLGGDLLLTAAGLFLAYLIRFEAEVPAYVLEHFPRYLLIIWIVKIPIFTLFGLYRMRWRYVSFKELLDVFQAVTMSSLLLGALLYLINSESLLGVIPRSIPILDYILTLFLISGFRSFKRVYNSLIRGFSSSGKRVLIAGAGDAGEQLIRAMLKETRSEYSPVGFVDDDPHKLGTAIHGVNILGACDEIPKIAVQHDPEQLIIAMPSAESAVIRKIVEAGRTANINEIKILPGFHDLVTGQISIGDVREVQLEDLLGREPVEIDSGEIGSYLENKVVVVTGAAGSIGSELCRQIYRFRPQKLIAIDQDESGIFHIENELNGFDGEIDYEVLICDVTAEQKIESAILSHNPDVLFHAAAYKHVPLMEKHPDEAVKNNIFGTLNVARAAQKAGADKFVLISTDKAVNPTSVMGTTKRVAEMLVHEMNDEGPTRFMAVRFGNVLGSRGSVIPEFQRQIQSGGPVTVTHKEMERYFMVTSEAVLLVLQAGAMGQGGEVFVLDMGSPVKIVELARELIRLSGYEPDTEIPIVFTGLRPGEKLFEELLTDQEGTAATTHKQIFIANLEEAVDPELISTKLDKLERLVERRALAELVDVLKELVPSYQRHDGEAAQVT